MATASLSQIAPRAVLTNHAPCPSRVSDEIISVEWGTTYRLEVAEKLGIDEALCTFVKGAVDSDDVALGNKLLEIVDTAGANGLGSSWGE